MIMTEHELDKTITDQLSKELASIEVPDIDAQWQKIRQRIVEENKLTINNKKRFVRKKSVLVAAVLILSVGSISLLSTSNANAFGGKISMFFNYTVGRTTKNNTETYTQSNKQPPPQVQNLGSNVQKEVTLKQAQSIVPFMLAIPKYLPSGATINHVELTSLGADVYQVSITYNIGNKAVVFTQQNSADETSRGSLYDVDDTKVKDLNINGNKGSLFLSKNNIIRVSWQLRGLILEISGNVPEGDIEKMANSIN